MSKPDHFYEPHLVIREFSLLPGGEWLPRSSGWTMFQVESGGGYWLHAQSSAELSAGTALLVAGKTPGCIRASQLGGMALHFFNVIPARLAGLMTLGEQDFLRRAASRSEPAFQVYQADHLIAASLREMSAGRNRSGVRSRLNLLRLFVEAFGAELEEQVAPSRQNGDTKERLRAFLQETPSDALLEINISDLARKMHCTPRHLSRIFYELTGVSFRDARAEVRLARARELLATSHSKVVEVALESGYKSLSLFNLMFRRHFGISPSRWRQKHEFNGRNGNHRIDQGQKYISMKMCR